jgi:hypothetical protein
MVVAYYPYCRLARCGVRRRAFTSGLCLDAPYFVAQAVGQDLISLAVVLPLLIISAILTSRGALLN